MWYSRPSTRQSSFYTQNGAPFRLTFNVRTHSRNDRTHASRATTRSCAPPDTLGIMMHTALHYDPPSVCLTTTQHHSDIYYTSHTHTQTYPSSGRHKMRRAPDQGRD